MAKKTETKDVQKKSTAKKTTKKATTPKKKVAAKKAEIKKVEKEIEAKKIEEVKVEEVVKEEPVKEVVPTEVKVEEQPKEEKKSSKTGLWIVVVLVTLLAIGYAVYNSMNGSATIKVSDISTTFADKETTIELPAGWLTTEDGSFFSKDGKMLTLKGAFYAVECTADEFATMSESLVEQYGFEKVEDETFEKYKMSETTEEVSVTYYLMFKDGIYNELYFLNATEEEINTVINSFNY